MKIQILIDNALCKCVIVRQETDKVRGVFRGVCGEAKRIKQLKDFLMISSIFVYSVSEYMLQALN